MTQPQRLSWPALLRLASAAGILLLLLTHTGSVQAQTVQRVVLSRVKPEYPALAMRMNISGNVLVDVSVQPDGSVSRVHAASGHAFLKGPAEQAVRRWRFSRAAAASDFTVIVHFINDTISNPQAPDPR